MSDFTTLGDDEKLKIKVPVKGATNWGDTMKSDTFQKIADHDHSGADGKGSLISKVGSSSQDTTIDASTKIALQKPLNLTPQTLPGGYTSAKGDMYIDTAGVLQIYNGTAWLTASQTSTIEGSQDVTFTRDSAHDGKMLKYNHSTTKFEPFIPNLNNLSDMNISGIGDTDILTYNNSTSKYDPITRANLAASMFTHASGDTNFESAALASVPHSLASSDTTTHQMWARADFNPLVIKLKTNTNWEIGSAYQKVKFNTTEIDTFGGSTLDTTLNKWTCPKAGYYKITFKVSGVDLLDYAELAAWIIKNQTADPSTTAGIIAYEQSDAIVPTFGDTKGYTTISDIFELAEDDYLFFWCNSSGDGGTNNDKWTLKKDPAYGNTYASINFISGLTN